ncbi:MAG: PIN domain-containing protein [Candidatus Nanopelagicaceae bacterium]|nr:PIN domain-containing protein [Candidatus Nanopelagicaceae bacterium]
MKKEFPEYFRPSEEEFKILWAQAFIVFDTNVLLNLYLAGTATRDSLFLDLTMMNERLWIPAQVAEEYLKRRVSKIGQQQVIYIRMYLWLKKITSDFEEIIKNVTRHPTFEKESIQQGFNKVFKRIEKVIKDQEKNHKIEFIRDIDDDEVLNQLTELYKDKVGRRWSIEELKVIFEEGAMRYENFVPPGYEDAKKKKSSNKENNDDDEETGSEEKIGEFALETRKYGDLILWKQLLEWSKTHDKPVIFVTGDSKEDWWLKDKLKQTIGPRPELLAEHYSETGKAFYMYKPETFWRYAREYLNSQTNSESIDEIERVAKGQEEEFSEIDSEKYYDRIDSLNMLGEDDRYNPSKFFGVVDPMRLAGFSDAVKMAAMVDPLKLAGLTNAVKMAAMVDPMRLAGLTNAVKFGGRESLEGDSDLEFGNSSVDENDENDENDEKSN